MVRLEGGVRPGDVEHLRIVQHQAEEGAAIAFEGPQLERRGLLRLGRPRGQSGASGYGDGESLGHETLLCDGPGDRRESIARRSPLPRQCL